MSDYETFQKWAAEADDIINGRIDLSDAYITGLPALDLIAWSDPKKAAFMSAIAARRRLKIALDRLNADGLAYEAMVAMNILDESAYGYIDYDNYDDDYPWPDAPPQQPANMFSHENEQFTPYIYSDERGDCLRYMVMGATSLAGISARGRTVSIGDGKEMRIPPAFEVDPPTAETAPECTVSLGTEDDLHKWQADADVYASTTQAGVTINSRTGSFTVPAGTTVTAEMLESLTWPNSPSYSTPDQEEMIAQGNRFMEFIRLMQIPMDDAIAMGEQMAEQLCGREWRLSSVDDAEQPGDHQSPLDAIGEDVLNTVIAPGRQGQTTAKPQAHTDPCFSPAAQHDMEPVEVWCKPKTGKAYRHAIRPRKAAEELVERNNSQYRGVAEYWIEP